MHIIFIHVIFLCSRYFTDFFGNLTTENYVINLFVSTIRFFLFIIVANLSDSSVENVLLYLFCLYLSVEFHLEFCEN